MIIGSLRFLQELVKYDVQSLDSNIHNQKPALKHVITTLDMCDKSVLIQKYKPISFKLWIDKL